MKDQELPHDDAAEEDVLAHGMRCSCLPTETLGQLTAADFFRPYNQLIFQAMLDLDREGRDLRPISVETKLRAQGSLQAAGTETYLKLLSYLNPGGIEAKVQTIKEYSLRRRLIQASSEITRQCTAMASTERGRLLSLAAELPEQALACAISVLAGLKATAAAEGGEAKP